MILTKSAGTLQITLGGMAGTASIVGISEQPLTTSDIVGIITVTGFVLFGCVKVYNDYQARKEQKRHNKLIEEQKGVTTKEAPNDIKQPRLGKKSKKKTRG